MKLNINYIFRVGGKQPTSLQEVTIRILDNADCKKRYGNEAPGGIVDSFLCARYPGKDSCSVIIQGESLLYQ